jgi:hypothetical protein
MSRNFGPFRDFQRPDPIEDPDPWQPPTKAQCNYMADLYKQLGKPQPIETELLSRREAAAKIHDLHLEWLRKQNGETPCKP